jgi:hypothetical protein
MGNVSMTTSEYNELLRKANLLDKVISIKMEGWSTAPELHIHMELLTPVIKQRFEENGWDEKYTFSPEKFAYASRFGYIAEPKPQTEEEEQKDE